MQVDEIIRESLAPYLADKSAVGTINRPLLHRQASGGAGEQGDREGRPYMLGANRSLTQHYEGR